MITVMNSIKESFENINYYSLYKFNNKSSSEKVYERNEFIIIKVKKGYIVYNTKKDFKNGHTHLKSFEMSKTVIDNNIRKRRPKTHNIYIIQSHIRVTNDDKYKEILEEMLETRKRNIKDDKYLKKSYNDAC